MAAEDKALPIEENDYDLSNNTCAHYAIGIAGSLGFKRTPGVAEFIVENLLNDDSFLTIAQGKIWDGGLRILSVAGKSGLQKFTKDLVSSQLDIHW